MRFFLDQNVDAAVVSFLRQQGHASWTAAEAGLSADLDDDLSVYADNRDAVLVSHDAEFGRRRRKNTIGRHLWLKCEEPDAVDVLTKHWGEVEELLEARSHIVLSVSWDKVRADTSWQ